MEITGQPRTTLQIPCCLCGTLIHPNPANQCGTCLAQQFDLKSILQRGGSGSGGGGGGNLTIYQCRQCRRYQHTENYFSHHEPESPSLLALCLKNIPALTSHHTHRAHGLSSLTLVDSMWIWTEPHSMRLKVRLTVRADVGESNRSVTVQQRLPIEFHVQWKQCPECNREFTNRTWHAVVQLRQKRQDESKKALMLLETAIARNSDVRKHLLSVETSRNGFDFYFMELMHAQGFASYLSTVYPIKVKTAQKLVSEDRRNNTANMKITVTCDMVPLNRHDLIVCDKRAAKEGCGAGRLNGRMCLVGKVSSSLQLIDASPPRTSMEDCLAYLHPEKYWKGEKHYRLIFSEKRLVRFVVMDVELCDDAGGGGGVGKDEPNNEESYKNAGKYALADVVVARESDLGASDETFQCTTHLGNILEIGDTVLGYDLISAVLAGGDEWSMVNSFNSGFHVPDVILVKKVKSGVGNSRGEEAAASEETEKKTKSKSSCSKRREKRKQKQEKKMKDLADTLERMGLSTSGVEGNQDSSTSSPGDWNTEKKVFDEALERDIELATLELNKTSVDK